MSKLYQMLRKIRKDFYKDLNEVKTLDDLKMVFTKYLGRKGIINNLFKELYEKNSPKRK